MKKELLIDNKKLLYRLSVVLFLVTEFLVLLLMYLRLPYLIDSDMSGEMILAKFMISEKSIMSKSWIYSTELRFLHIHLLFAFFFLFSNNWHLVRFLTILALHAILFGSIYYLCKKIGIKRYVPAICCAVLLAFTYQYFNIVLCAACYVPFIAVTFVTIGLAISYGSSDKRKKIYLLAISLFLSVSTGLNGIRQIVVTYLPLFAAVFMMSILDICRKGWEEYKNSPTFDYLIFSFINLVVNGIGFIINSKFLSKIYYYRSWNAIQFTNINLDRVMEIINGFLYTLGFEAYYLTIETLISNGVCFALIVAIVYCTVRGLRSDVSKGYQFLTAFFLSNLLIFIAIYAVSDMQYIAWYNFLVLIIAFPLVAIGLHESDFGKAPKQTKTVLAILCILMMFARSAFCYRDVINRDKNNDLVEIAEFLKTTDYNCGYATFWNSDVMTELTDGKEEMYSWIPSGDGTLFAQIKNVNDIYPWLQARKHLEEKPEGKVFIIYEDKEIEYCNWKDLLDSDDIIFKTDKYTVYGYDSYTEMNFKLTK